MRPYTKQLDIYSELCPVSSATVIGAGLITMTVGSASTGVVFLLAGIAVGIAGPLAKNFQDRRKRRARRK